MLRGRAVETQSLTADIIRDFLMLFVTIDPIGTLSLFVPLTSGMPAVDRPRIARRAVFWAGVVLFAFMATGQVVMNGLGVRLVSFQLAGGIILFLLGIQMVFGTGIAEEGATPEKGRDVAVFPLAIPSIASPGAIMAVVLLTDNDRFSLVHQIETGVVLLVVLLFTLLILRGANPILRLIGDTGATVLVRVMGLLLAALATEETLASISDFVRELHASIS